MGYEIDTIGILINVGAVFLGLFIYVKIMRSEWGQEHRNLQFIIMFACLLGAILVGWGIRTLVAYLRFRAMAGM
ncbi:MAG: hypothetical protein IJI65_04910 [Lachnospiraceae bacterium]|nr:hypothetical protein [Lachnospiraceae bacterium]MBQ6259508.1 hypothetical protein [Lachnospiraceae bacterium]